jgi:Arc/MetJ-type ribon-helix-helix transcriptional regulator
VREGLKLLEVRENEREAVIADIRREIAVGLEEAKAGRLNDGETFFDDQEREGPPTT